MLGYIPIGLAPDEWQGLLQHLSDQGFGQNELTHAGLLKLSPKSGRPYDAFRNRVIFPIRDTRGRSIAFGARSIEADQIPKYLNSPETKYYRKSHVLYGFYEGLSAIKQSRHLILVEGYLDVIRLHEFGFQQAVATCGTALTSDHVQLAKRYVDQVTVILDGDVAGQKAALKSCPLFLSNNVEASVVILPEGEDPDDFLLKQGKEPFSKLLQHNIPVFEYLVQQSLAKYSPNVQGRTKAVEELLPIIDQIQGEELQQLTLTHLAELIHLPVNVVMGMSPKSLLSSKKHDTLANLHSSSSATHEDRDEKWILQALLTSKHLIRVAREHLHTNELTTPRFQQLYGTLLQLTDEEFQSMSVEEFGRHFPDIYHHLMEIYMDDFLQASAEQQIKLSIRRVKERHLKAVLNEKLATAQSDEEKLRASLEFRKQCQALDQFFPQR